MPPFDFRKSTHDVMGTNLAFPEETFFPGKLMPTILLLNGWRFYFFTDEGNEPVHIHCVKGDAKAKYWLNAETYEVIEASSVGLNPADKRNVRKIIYNHFDYFLEEWNSFQELKNG